MTHQVFSPSSQIQNETHTPLYCPEIRHMKYRSMDVLEFLLPMLKENGEIKISLEELSGATKFSESTVKRALNNLTELKVIEKVRPNPYFMYIKEDDGRYTKRYLKNIYKVNQKTGNICAIIFGDYDLLNQVSSPENGRPKTEGGDEKKTVDIRENTSINTVFNVEMNTESKENSGSKNDNCFNLKSCNLYLRSKIIAYAEDEGKDKDVINTYDYTVDEMKKWLEEETVIVNNLNVPAISQDAVRDKNNGGDEKVNAPLEPLAEKEPGGHMEGKEDSNCPHITTSGSLVKSTSEIISTPTHQYTEKNFTFSSQNDVLKIPTQVEIDSMARSDTAARVALRRRLDELAVKQFPKEDGTLVLRYKLLGRHVYETLFEKRHKSPRLLLRAVEVLVKKNDYCWTGKIDRIVAELEEEDLFFKQGGVIDMSLFCSEDNGKVLSLQKQQQTQEMFNRQDEHKAFVAKEDAERQERIARGEEKPFSFIAMVREATLREQMANASERLKMSA